MSASPGDKESQDREGKAERIVTREKDGEQEMDIECETGR